MCPAHHEPLCVIQSLKCKMPKRHKHTFVTLSVDCAPACTKLFIAPKFCMTGLFGRTVPRYSIFAVDAL